MIITVNGCFIGSDGHPHRLLGIHLTHIPFRAGTGCSSLDTNTYVAEDSVLGNVGFNLLSMP